MKMRPFTLKAMLLAGMALLSACQPSRENKPPAPSVSSALVSAGLPKNPPKPTPSSSVSQENLRVPILVYHSVAPYHAGQTASQRAYSVEPEVFERQLKYLKDNGYTALTLRALADAAAANAPLPAKPYVLTFDDGWENQYTHAVPLLKKYGVTATFFVWTNAIGHGAAFMTWDQLKEIEGLGMPVESHTLSHPRFDKIKDGQTLWAEISESKKAIEDHLGKTATLFAYPFGKVTPLSQDQVKKAGYFAARGLGGRSFKTGDDLFGMPAFIAPTTEEGLIKMVER